MIIKSSALPRDLVPLTHPPLTPVSLCRAPVILLPSHHLVSFAPVNCCQFLILSLSNHSKRANLKHAT